MKNLKWSVSPLAIAVALSSAAFAADDQIDTITVTASKMRSFDEVAATGSRLGLTQRETPATLDVIDVDEIVGRGLHSIQQVMETMTGTTTADVPGALILTMRGFSGNQIMTLSDGMYLGPSNFSFRPGNSFTLERVEVLKGPASMLYGQGAIGGVVNTVTKKPNLDAPETNILASIGSFGTTNVGIGTGAPLSDTVAFRVDVGRVSTKGYINDAGSDALTVASSLLLKPNDEFEAVLRLDYYDDNTSSYWGTPLVPLAVATQPLKGVMAKGNTRAIDKRTADVNYNVTDPEVSARQWWPKLTMKFTPSEDIGFDVTAFYYQADRNWENSETYTYNRTTGRVDRDRFFISHDHEIYTAQGSGTFKGQFGDLKNTFVAGLYYSDLSFGRTRGFPAGDSVDLFNPNRGQLGPKSFLLTPTYWDNWAVFFEDVLEITPDLKFVTGGRYDSLDLDRRNFLADGVTLNTATSFKRVFKSKTGRAGLIYNITPNLTPYISFTMGQDPVGSAVFTVNANQNFDLADSRQVEVGLKGNTVDNNLDFTLSAYSIRRKNILTATSQNTTANIGSQKSDGFEGTINFKPAANWTVSANAAYTDARYGVFRLSPTVDASGNGFPNVPKVTWNIWTSIKDVGGLPVEIGGGVRHVGKRFGDDGGTTRFASYEIVTAYVSYDLLDNLRLTGRVNNAFDQNYVQWMDRFYPDQASLGQPRYFELEVVSKF